MSRDQIESLRKFNKDGCLIAEIISKRYAAAEIQIVVVYDYRHGTVLNIAVEGLIAARLNNNVRFEELYGIWIEKLSEDKRFANIIPILTSPKVSLDNLIDHPLV